jgi:hypothetical protein
VALWLAGFALLRRRSPARLTAAGALWGAGAALRPEFYWLAAWSVGALFISHKGERLRAAAWPAAAFLAVAAGLELAMQAVWGQPAFMRFAANLSYGAPRGPEAFLYAVGHSLVPFVPWYLGVGGGAVLAVGVAGSKWRPGPYVAAACAVPLVVLYWSFFGGFATSLAAAFPAAFALVFLARPEGRAPFRGLSALEKSFYVAALGFAAALFVVLPDTSGFAWGPRFLLYVVPPAALALGRLTEGGGRARATLIALLVAASVATQGFGLGRWVVEKRARHGLVAALAALDDAPTLVNAWYLPAYAAPLYHRRPFVLTTDERQLPALREALTARGVRRAYFLTEVPPGLPEGSDYVLGLTNALAGEFDITDLGEIGPTGGRYQIPYFIWWLRVSGDGSAP